MSKVKVIVMTLIASFAFGTVAVSSASAADEWFVNGTRLVGSAALAQEAPLDTLGTLLVPNLPLTIDCEGPLLLLGAYIYNPARVLANAFDFENCSTLSPAKCALSSSTIFTVGSDLQGIVTLAPSGGGAGRLAGKTGEPEFANLDIVGAECSIAGEKAVKGEVVFGAPGATTESETHELEGLGSQENNSLTVGGSNKAYIERGRALIRLASGSKWSFHG